jgi:serine phosphatase RsbU (regulator of sigma subunit)
MFIDKKVDRFLAGKLKCLLSLLAFSFCPVPSPGQVNIDSLYNLLAAAKHDTLKILIRAEIGEQIPILRLSYWDSIRIDAEKWNMKKTIAQATNNIGFVYDEQGDVTNALFYYNEGLKLRKEIGEKHGIAESLNNLAIVYEGLADIPHALECHFAALKIQEEIHDSVGLSLSFNNIAYIYEYQEDIPKALEYYKKSLAISQKIGSKDLVAMGLNNIGLLYRKLATQAVHSGKQKSDSLGVLSMEYFTKALRLFSEMNDYKGIATEYQNIGMLNMDKNDLPVAKEYYAKSLVLWEKIKNKSGAATVLTNMGELYFKEKDYSRALSSGQQALKLVKEIGYPKDISITASLLSEVYKAQNKWKDALEMQELYYSMRDSTRNETTRKATLQKQFQYEYDKKEALLKAEQEKERAVAQEKSRKQRIIIWSIVFGLVIVAVFAALIYRSLRLTRRQKQVIEIKNRETEMQKKIIEEKNKDITDSIVYAKRIQQAQLPEKKEIQSFFPQSFVLFKPKDIVSGDFYFFHQSDHTCFLAAVDCTGHGVPGALMSMLGSEKLHEAIDMNPDTSEILRQLNIGIRYSLHQTDDMESTRDGMDIALCSIDLHNQILKYAGANRPIWIIRRGQTEVEEIQGTKKAIGGLTEDSQVFDSHEIKLNAGDSFYIFSDGYADTFGGNSGTKLKNKRFRELLLEIQNKEMPQQEKYLDDFIENWRGGVEQVDDILIIGIRL